MLRITDEMLEKMKFVCKQTKRFRDLRFPLILDTCQSSTDLRHIGGLKSRFDLLSRAATVTSTAQERAAARRAKAAVGQADPGSKWCHLLPKEIISGKFSDSTCTSAAVVGASRLPSGAVVRRGLAAPPSTEDVARVIRFAGDFQLPPPISNTTTEKDAGPSAVADGNEKTSSTDERMALSTVPLVPLETSGLVLPSDRSGSNAVGVGAAIVEANAAVAAAQSDPAAASPAAGDIASGAAAASPENEKWPAWKLKVNRTAMYIDDGEFAPRRFVVKGSTARKVSTK